MALLIPIPNQYAKQNVAYSYQFPAGTFSGSPTYTAYVNRPIKGRRLPPWLSFNAGTRTFSGTPTKWWHCEAVQIVVEADVAGTKSYSIFTLVTGASDNTGRPVFRSGSTPDHIITADNIGGFDHTTVSAGQWVLIDISVTKVTMTSPTLAKIAAMRAQGGYLVWLYNDENGLYAYQAYRFDFTQVEAGETIAIDFTAGNIRAFQPKGKLHKGLRGKEIYVTNYSVKGFITSLTSNPDPSFSTTPVLCERDGDSVRSDSNLRFIGQPADHTPFINLYGLGFKGGNSLQIKSRAPGYVECAFVDVQPGQIGFHIKTDLNASEGDRRPSMNRGGLDHNMKYIQIHDCRSDGGGGEIFYVGGGEWRGQLVKVYHYNTDGSNKMVIHNGNSVHEYHYVKRYYHQLEYVRADWNILTNAGWDFIQFKDCSREVRVFHNYCLNSGRSSSASMAQCEGIFMDGTGDCEVAYNYVEAAYNVAYKIGSTGNMSMHHNIAYDIGNDLSNPELPDEYGGGAIYGAGRGLLTQDLPALDVAERADYDPLTSYNYDSFQHIVQIKYLGKAYRSVQPGNIGNQPDISPLWWEWTKEETSWVARPDLLEADLFWKCFHNTLIKTKNFAFELYIHGPAGKMETKNNLFINCGPAPDGITMKGGGNKAGNIMLIGQTLTAWFNDITKRDFRLKAAVSAIDAGVDVSSFVNGNDFEEGFTDFGGTAHGATPDVGAFEYGAGVNDEYLFALYDVAGGGTIIPPPITINAGLDMTVRLPLVSGVIVTAIKSDPARVLDVIAWDQLQGPNTATITNGDTLTATFTDLIKGTYRFRISVTDEHGQVSTDSVLVTVEDVVTVTSFQWYIADDANGTNKAPIQGATGKKLDVTPFVGMNKWIARGIKPISKTGNLVGQENLSNWINIA